MAIRFKKNPRVEAIIISAAADELQKLGETVVKAARGSMRRQSSPSSPGEPPRIDTGELVNSIEAEVRQDRNGVTVRVGTNVEHGLHLELGTRDIAPRPWLRPALRKLKR